MKVTDEFIVEKVEEHFDDVVWEIRHLCGSTFDSAFNLKMRDLVPELKDCKKNMYKIYNTYQPQ